LHGEAITKTWFECEFPFLRIERAYDILESATEPYHEEGGLLNEDGQFDLHIENPADMKREVYFCARDRRIVIDDQLVYDVAALTVQKLIYPDPSCMLVHLLGNACDYMLAIGKVAAAQAVAHDCVARALKPTAAVGHPPIRALSGTYNSVVEQIRDGIRLGCCYATRLGIS
jgi:hypothetical protein